MPVDYSHRDKNMLYQRNQYALGGIGRFYWDCRDSAIIKNITEDANVILDLGCGEGITLEKLLKLYPKKDIRGIDTDKENIDICKSFNLPVFEGNIFDLNIASGSIDCCILLEVIEHLENYDLALKEVSRILKKDGRLLIVFPNDINFKIARLFTLKFREAFYDPGHLYQFTPNVLGERLKGLGFKIIKTNNIPFFFWNISLHCLIVAAKSGS